MKKDTTSTTKPTKGYEKPTKGHEKPTKGYENPTKGHENPTKGHENPTKAKLIHIKEEDVIPLQILAAKAGKDLKNFIQDSLSELAQSAAQ